MEKRYIVFIKSEYVRDAQAYIGNTLPSNDSHDIHKNEVSWWDVQGSILIMDRVANDVETIKQQLKTCYPFADAKIFEIIECAETIAYRRRKSNVSIKKIIYSNYFLPAIVFLILAIIRIFIFL